MTPSASQHSPSRELGQFFTPDTVVDLAFAVLQWLSPAVNSGLLADISCGEGAFLAGAIRSGFHPDRLYGLDADPHLPVLWNKLFSPSGPHLAVADGLLGQAAECFDVVVGNPPFAGGPDPAHLAALTPAYQWWRLTHARRPEGLPRELWFLERSLELLKRGGLLAMVLPEGTLANRRWRPQRERLLQSSQIEAVIGLPRATFRAARTTVKTCLVFLRKQEPASGHVVRLAELDEEELNRPQDLLEAWKRQAVVAEDCPWRRPDIPGKRQ